MIRDGKENDLSSCFGNPFRRSLVSIENDLSDAFKNENVKKETVKKEKIIIIEGQIIS
jgi:hypothetical protein